MDLDTFIKKLDSIEPEFEKEFLVRVAEKTPVSKQDKGDVGRLKRGWSWQQDQDGRYLTNEAPYAIYVEMGTWKMAPVMMAGTTVVEAPDILKKAIQESGL